MADKPEYAVDLDIGVIVAATLHPTDHGDIFDTWNWLLTEADRFRSQRPYPGLQRVIKQSGGY